MKLAVSLELLTQRFVTKIDSEDPITQSYIKLINKIKEDKNNKILLFGGKVYNKDIEKLKTSLFFAGVLYDDLFIGGVTHILTKIFKGQYDILVDKERDATMTLVAIRSMLFGKLNLNFLEHEETFKKYGIEWIERKKNTDEIR